MRCCKNKMHDITLQAMDLGYIRLWRSGPSEEEQRAALTAVGVEPSHIEVDPLRPRRGKLRTDEAERPNDPHEGLPATIRRVRQGDRIVVHSAAVLTVGREQVREVLAAIGRKGGSLYDAAAGLTVPCPDMVEVEAFIDRAEIGWQSARTAHARKALVGIKRGPEKTKLKISDAQAEAMWHDPQAYTKRQVEDATGVKRRTLSSRFGAR